MNFFSTEHIAVKLLEYPLSHIEIMATLTGLVSVWFAALKRLGTWPFGIANEVGFFVIFFQVKLYASMLLQVYFLVVSLYGWYYWRAAEQEKPVIQSSTLYRRSVAAVLLISVLITGFLVANLHLWLPSVFAEEAAAPWLDSFIAVASMIAMWLMARKRIECWVLWILVDILSIYLYFSRDVALIALQYVAFLALACHGLHHWRTLRA